MKHKSNEHLEMFTQAERAAYYEPPDFNKKQHYEYLTLTQNELDLVMSRNSWGARVYCCLQIAYPVTKMSGESNVVMVQYKNKVKP